KDSTDEFEPELLDKQDFGNGLAPRGRLVMDALLGSRDNIPHNIVGVTNPIDFDGAEDERSATGWNAVAFYAGRVWFAGDSNPKRPNGVYFSRTLRSTRDSGTFMQVGDPTAENFSELLADDGGVIYITEAEQIIRLVPYGVGLLVLASNGIWFIYGG